MNLKELKGMIAEEYSSYLKEQEEVAVDVQPDVDVDPMGAMGDEDGDDKDSEATLKTIYDMLSDYFEGEEGEDDDMDNEEPMDDVEGEEDAEADLDENATTSAQYQKTGMAAGGAGKGGTGYDAGSVGGKGRTGYDAKSIALQERFQKLANIIK